MKTTPSRYVLAVEILTIILLHAVKIRQAEKHPADMAFNPTANSMQITKPVVENKPGAEFILLNLVK
jgi:hypothetical protein